MRDLLGFYRKSAVRPTAELLEFLPESRDPGVRSMVALGKAHQHTYPPDRTLLRVRRERPHSR